MPSLLDPFLPQPEVRERHEILIHAPAAVVMDVALHFDMQSIPLVRAIIWLRGKMLGAKQTARVGPVGLIEEMQAIGWGRLAEETGRFFVAGAVCEPWQADVVFTPIAAERFASFHEPEKVKIAWTLEAEAVAEGVTRFSTETRAAGTDAEASARFRRYWRRVGIGVVLIRRLLLPALRKEAEKRTAP